MNDGRPVSGPMSIGELLDRTIQLCRKVWLPLIGLGLLGALPWLINPPPAAPTLIERLLTATAIVSSPIPITSNQTFLVGNTAGLLALLTGGALILVASQAILGQPIRLGSALKVAWQRVLAIWGTNIVAGLCYLGATILLRQIGRVIPLSINLVLTLGLSVSLNLIFCFRGQALLLEGLPGGSRPIGRSLTLVRRRFWSVAAFSLLLTIGTTLLSAGWGLLVGLFSKLGLDNRMGILLSLLPQVWTVPVMAVGLTLLYYDTRIRLEGLDLVLEPSA